MFFVGCTHSSIISGNVGEDYGEQSMFEVVKGRCPLNPALWVSARTLATPPCWYAQCSQMLFRRCEWTLLHRATMVHWNGRWFEDGDESNADMVSASCFQKDSSDVIACADVLRSIDKKL